jgi:hypothetical protein
VVERAVAEHLEVLGDSASRRSLVAEGVGHADALDGLLRDAIDLAGFGDAGDLENCWSDVDHVVKLGSQPALIGDVAGPRHDQAVAGAAEVRGDLFHPLERR